MMTIAEKELVQTYRRTSSLFKESERLVKECCDRHDGDGCLAESDCRARWKRLTDDNDGFILPMSAFQVFRKDLRRLEAQGFKGANQSGQLLSMMGTISIVGLVCLVITAYYGVLGVMIL